MEQVENDIAQFLKSKKTNQESHSGGDVDDVFNLKSDLDMVQQWLHLNKEQYFPFSKDLMKNLTECRKFRIDGNEQFHLKNYEKALSYYNQAISLAPIDDPQGLEEISRCYANRSLILKELKKPESSLTELNVAIFYCLESDQLKKLLFRKIKLLEDLEKYEQALQLILDGKLDNFNDVEMKFLEQQQEVIGKKFKLQQLNSLNMETPEQRLKKSLKSLRIPLLAQKFDQKLIENFLNDASDKLMTIDPAVQLIDNDGTALKVQKELANGSLLSIEKCLAIMTNQNEIIEQKYCQHCLTEITVYDLIHPCLFQCRSIYCSRKCQQESSEQFHQKECCSTSKNLLQYLSPSTRLLLRLLIRLNCPIDSEFFEKLNGVNETIIVDEFNNEQSFKKSFMTIIRLANEKFMERNFRMLYPKPKQLLEVIILKEILANNNDSSLALLKMFWIFNLEIKYQFLEMIKIDNSVQIDQEGFDQILEFNYRELMETDDNSKWDRYDTMLNDKISKNLSKTIAIALYPLTPFIVANKDNDLNGFKSSNIRQIYSQTWKLLRASKKLSKNDQLIGFVNLFDPSCFNLKYDDFKLPSVIKYDDQFYDSLETFFFDLIEKYEKMKFGAEEKRQFRNYDWIKLSLGNHLARYYLKRMKNFQKAKIFNDECLKILKGLKESIESSFNLNQIDYLEQMESFILMRNVRIKFELYTDSKTKLSESIELAKQCLMDASSLMKRLHQFLSPLRLIQIKQADLEQLQTLIDRGDGGEDLLKNLHPLLPWLIEIEDTMITCDLFIQQFSKTI